ncbi:MAG: LmeA family phospholipid-binding protein [Leucobacter sp.]
MSLMKRTVVTLVVLAVLAGLLEVGLRAVMPSMIESGSRMALRAPQSSSVEVTTKGSMLLNALRWRIADVKVVAEDVPLSENLTATATLDVGSMPLFPAFGNLKDGTATFDIPADQLDGMAQFMSSGLADWGEMREGALVSGGVLTDKDFELPQSPEFEIPYEATIDLTVDADGITVTPSNVVVEGQGQIGTFLSGAMAEPRTVCIADRLPEGVTVTEISVSDSGGMVMRADLSEGLLSSPSQRSRGTCE